MTTEATQIDLAERKPGYVIAKLCQLSRKKHGEKSKELLTLLQSLKSKATNTYISASQLVTPCQDLVNIVEIAEVLFRKQVSQSNLRNIPVEKILNLTLCSHVVKSLWDNIILSSELQPSSSTHKLCLENIIKLYLRVRSFSYAKDYITKYNIKEKQLKGKALRKI